MSVVRRPRRLSRALVVVGTLLALGVGAACQLIEGIHDDHFTVAPSDASVALDTTPGVDAAIPDFCHHALPPPPPPPDSSVGALGTYVIAVDEYYLSGHDEAGAAPGYDLDGVCTCFDGGTTAYDAAPSCVPADKVVSCDGEGGLDNGLASLFTLFSTVPGLTNINSLQLGGIRCGKQSVVIVLSEYNGLANDGQITLGTVLSHGIYETLEGATPAPADPAACGVQSGSDGGTLPQKRDGTDVWSSPSSAIDSNSTPDKPIAAKTASGYVTDYQLIVTFQTNQRLAFAFGSTELDVASGTLVARLVPVDANNQPIPLGPDGNASATPHGFALVDGVFGGRLSVQDFVSAIGTTILKQDDDGGGVKLECQDVTFPALSSFVCNGADIPSAPNLDFQGQPCDGVSVMIPFNGSAAHLFGIHDATGPTVVCPDSGVPCGL